MQLFAAINVPVFFLLPLMKGLILRQNLSALPFRKCRVPIQPPIQPPVQPPVQPPIQPPVQPHVQPPVQPRRSAWVSHHQSLFIAGEQERPSTHRRVMTSWEEPLTPHPPPHQLLSPTTTIKKREKKWECLLPADRREKGRVTEKVSPAARLKPPEGGCS